MKGGVYRCLQKIMVSVFPKRSVTRLTNVMRTESPTTKLPTITATVITTAIATNR